jgi:hypothetical protein
LPHVSYDSYEIIAAIREAEDRGEISPAKADLVNIELKFLREGSY